MAATKNLCAQVPIDLHQRQRKDQAGQTTSQYITALITEYSKLKGNGGTAIMASGKNRTLAFQISEELFQHIKAHLERQSARLGRSYTQWEFVIGPFEQALAEVEPDTQDGADAVPASPRTKAGDEPPPPRVPHSTQPNLHRKDSGPVTIYSFSISNPPIE